MKYIDVEEMRVVTSDKHIAEQIKSDSTVSARNCLLNRKVENVVMNGPAVGNIGEGTTFEEHRDEWSQEGEFGKVENCENNEETMSQSEEKMCKSIIRGLVKRNHEKHTMLAVICFDDITGKELPWHAVREAREPTLGKWD